MSNIKRKRNMKKINPNCKCWALLLCLLVWLPISSLAQTEQFEMVDGGVSFAKLYTKASFRTFLLQSLDDSGLLPIFASKVERPCSAE